MKLSEFVKRLNLALSDEGYTLTKWTYYIDAEYIVVDIQKPNPTSLIPNEVTRTSIKYRGCTAKSFAKLLNLFPILFDNTVEKKVGYYGPGSYHSKAYCRDKLLTQQNLQCL